MPTASNTANADLPKIAQLLKNFRDASSDTATQGRYFEKFCREWLVTSRRFPEISNAYLWSDWEHNDKTHDIGVDIVAETDTGEYWAIQCKFYDENGTIPKSDIDSFLASVGKIYNGISFSQLLIMTTAPLSGNASEEILNREPPCVVIRVDEFEDDECDWDEIIKRFNSGAATFFDEGLLAPRKKIRPHQEEAIKDVKKGFETNDRGKLIMACGTGKTFTSLKIVEETAPQNGLVLYLVPSLMLLSQTLSEWTRESDRKLAPILVCSDSQAHERDSNAANALFGGIKKKGKVNIADYDNPTVDATELTRPASTRPETVAKRYQEIECANVKRLEKDPESDCVTVVFSTYQSIQTIADAQHKGAMLNGKKVTLPEFDLIICDEAHRTTGAKLSTTEDSDFVKVHNNDVVAGKKRLYMTATPRVYGDAAKTSSKEKNAVLCSMDDESIYGPTFHYLSFGDAVTQKLLSDYKVIVLAVSDQDSQLARVTDAAKKAAPDETHKEDAAPTQVEIDDVAKMIGCWRGLSKIGENMDSRSDDFAADPVPMKRAVAFCRSIKDSKEFIQTFAKVSEELVKATIEENETYQTDDEEALETSVEQERAEPLQLEFQHIDGGFPGKERQQLLAWLRGEDPGYCRVLSNVRCLSEGVDVPNLDAAIFFAPRNSQVDVIQAVGRVMRKAPGKNFGYIILPIVIPHDVPADVALDNNEKYKVVWQTLNALRSHDNRFQIMINQLQVGEKPSGITITPYGGNLPIDPDHGVDVINGPDAKQLTLDFDEQVKESLYAQIVKRCGNRSYLDNWAKDVAKMTAKRVDIIRERLANPTEDQRVAFNAFLKLLQTDVNPNLTKSDALDFLTQHITTLPVFDALLGENIFSSRNPIAIAIQKVVDAFNVTLSEKELELEKQFQADVRAQIEGIQTDSGQRQVIHKLYEQFFNVALPKTAEKLGVVYTPDEVVDYILHSVDYVLRSELNTCLSAKDVHILDPFTGTGSFISRLLASGLIAPNDFIRKYESELHANEIMLLAYYIAAVNIEKTYADCLKKLNLETKSIIELDGTQHDDTEFRGIVLTDTFQTTEKTKTAEVSTSSETSDNAFWFYRIEDKKTSNSKRLKKQKESHIEVIIGNPPYSVGQKSTNDNNQNVKYKMLEDSIATTYAAKSKATTKTSLYDSYVKAFRWASNRLNGKGIIGFVSNGGYIDNTAMEGFRKCLAEEFAAIYVFNLRGNARTSGELRRKEKDNVFGQGTRTPVAITILVKKPHKGEARIYYHDIGDYLTREEKLNFISEFHSVENTPWDEITPNEQGDWINQRSDKFEKLIPLGDKKEKDGKEIAFFAPFYGRGMASGRDAWVYNFSKSELQDKMRLCIDEYNSQLEQYNQEVANGASPKAEEYIHYDSSKISWTFELISDFKNNKSFTGAVDTYIRTSSYRPFTKEYVFFHSMFNSRHYQLDKQFPTPNTPNLMICLQGAGETKEFSTIITDAIPDLHYCATTQCFPLYYYEPADKNLLISVDEKIIDGYVQKSAITDAILIECQERITKGITKEDIFFYVYGALHSPSYRERYENELKKELARLPLPNNPSVFWHCSRVGRELADIHINYETGESTIKDAVDEPDKLDGQGKVIQRGRKGKFHKQLAPYPMEIHYLKPGEPTPSAPDLPLIEGVVKPITVFISNSEGLSEAELYRVKKMKLDEYKKEKGKSSSIKEPPKGKNGTLVYNEHITFTNIPLKAFEYVVNGRSPIEWLVERYQVKTDKASGIVNDPNLWAPDNPKYIFDLIPRLVALSLRTLELTEGLPDLEEDGTEEKEEK